MRTPVSLLLLGIGALALAWGVHDMAQVLVETGGCSTDDPQHPCPPGAGLAIVVTIAAGFTMFAGLLVGESTRTGALMMGLFLVSLGLATGWSQLGPSAQPGGPSAIALGVAALALFVGAPLLVAINATNPPVPSSGGDGDGGSSGFWGFDFGGDSSSDSGGDSGCGGGCGGGD